MTNKLSQIMMPDGKTKYLFLGGKGGVGKTTMATSIAIWFAEHNYKTTIVSTDPTVSLSTVFQQEIGGEKKVDINLIPNLCGMNINPKDAKGVFQNRFNALASQFNNDPVEEVLGHVKFLGIKQKV
ncbi:MAG: AAA family ATPase [Candidatus Kapabacteria bacterium]|nr:AAA family ATPase [Candidatus Kapabacteria bacterium]